MNKTQFDKLYGFDFCAHIKNFYTIILKIFNLIHWFVLRSLSPIEMAYVEAEAIRLLSNFRNKKLNVFI